jgi:ABC-type multidrug transport system fused ATPase/permease subunit
MFTYSGQKSPALEGVDFQIPSGKMTALVGPSGAGKTTLVDVLAGLRVPQEGRVLMDGVPLAEYDLSSIRRSIAFVSQEAFIFNDTVKNNLSFARPEATNDEIHEAMDRAMVTEFVAALPQDWDTMLGERGTRLSGGQKQRLSLARALLQEAPILVLDEATSALDSEKEMEIQSTIRDLRQKEGMTIVAIAHRLSTIREADIIVVLDRGKVQEVGPHERLMHSAEWYSRVSSLQTGATR